MAGVAKGLLRRSRLWRRSRRKQWLVLKQGLMRDLGLRLFALLLAVGLWVFVNSGQRGLLSLRVPVSYRPLPAGMVLLGHRPEFVNVDVTGPRTLLSLIQPDRIGPVLDLSKARVGKTVIRLTPQMFDVPRQTDVRRVVPTQITLDVDRVVEREVPVNLRFVGEAAAGYKVSATEVAPSTVKVRGPSSFLANLRQIQTKPLQVSDAAHELTAQLPLVNPDHGVALLGSGMVTAKVEIEQIITDRVFRHVRITRHNARRRVRLEPSEVSVTVRGPVLALAKLTLDGAVYVEVDDAAPGVHYLPVEVRLPEGVELVRRSPSQVKLLVYSDQPGR